MSKCGDGAVHVLQMVACTDARWCAVFADPLSKSGYRTEPVACWLLVEHSDGERHVHPAVSLATAVSDATLVDDYVGVAGPGVDPAVLVKALQLVA